MIYAFRWTSQINVYIRKCLNVGAGAGDGAGDGDGDGVRKRECDYECILCVTQSQLDFEYKRSYSIWIDQLNRCLFGESSTSAPSLIRLISSYQGLLQIRFRLIPKLFEHFGFSFEYLFSYAMESFQHIFNDSFRHQHLTRFAFMLFFFSNNFRQ